MLHIDPEFSTLGLVLAVPLLAQATVGDALLGRRSYARLRRDRDRDPRALVRLYRLWIATSWGLAALGALTVVVSPGVAAGDIGLTWPGDPARIAGMLVGLAIVLPLTVLVGRRMAARGKAVPGAEGVTELLPRDARERRLGLAMSVTAGICEEFVYRGVLIALFVGVLGVPVQVAAGIALALFAVAHAYQGWRNMLLTLLPGYALTAMYLSTGSLLLPVLVHILIDVRGLVLTPAPAAGPRPVAQNG
ncbi:hypothetical protein GCM10009678_75050 [Actinomadura kijaniata]|uniref:Membrane protease YdiL (CAAX protease family) n=1 Tax=Actinomadura namibiensis TaxID=182080 RepID=A0A7W3LYG6_ACTNM|nr:CPBP family intramembrane glutamic endopeptidase [Actinomadura namibiensis]MBA8956658.1 membrane protease YdiL (CAAX protease family) [Actinomadura namibiensis]